MSGLLAEGSSDLLRTFPQFERSCQDSIKQKRCKGSRSGHLSLFCAHSREKASIEREEITHFQKGLTIPNALVATGREQVWFFMINLDPLCVREGLDIRTTLDFSSSGIVGQQVSRPTIENAIERVSSFPALPAEILSVLRCHTSMHHSCRSM